MKPEHTPLRRGDLDGRGWYPLLRNNVEVAAVNAHLVPGERYDLAVEIVRAVNTHAELVAERDALRARLEMLAGFVDEALALMPLGTAKRASWVERAGEARLIARAALAQARKDGGA